MKLHEIYRQRGPTIIELARKITRVCRFQPVSKEEMRWLVELSKDGLLIHRLYKLSRRMNYRSPVQTDHMLLTDSGTCAKAYILLTQLQDQIRRK